MKKIWLIALLALFITPSAKAVNMVQTQSYLDVPVRIVGLPDFPPFSYYENFRSDNVLHGVFLEPIQKILKKINVESEVLMPKNEEVKDVRLLLIKAKSGDAEMFIGSYADTTLFSGLEVIYPAVVSNPIHLIAQSDIHEKVKNIGDLRKLKGIACKTEYFSDFVLRKFKELNISYVDTPYEAYEMVIKGKADYMLGSLYYNKIMASRYGLGDYLKYSKNPLWKIPLFISLSKVMPVLSEYKKALQAEFNNPAFAHEIKQNIIDAVNEEVDKNAGIVPPSFIEEVSQQPEEEKEDFTQDKKISTGHIVEQKVHQKTIDEVLDGL